MLSDLKGNFEPVSIHFFLWKDIDQPTFHELTEQLQQKGGNIQRFFRWI